MEETEVAIIGGGVVGVSAALLLAEWGVPCVLLEKGRVAAEQSSRNWGWIRMQGRDLAEVPLMAEAQALWRRWGTEAMGFRQAGVTYLSETEGQLAAQEAWRDAVRPFQIAPRLLSRTEAAEAAGRGDRRLAGGMRLDTDCHAEPGLAVPELAQRARAAGAAIREGCAVRALLREGGRVAGVVTERGTIRARATILAGGAWSRTLLENEGLPFPQLGIRSSVIRTGPVRPFTAGPLGAPSASLRPRLDGGMTVAKVGAARFDLVPAAFRHLRAFLPTLRARWRITTLRLGREWSGPLGRHRWNAGEPSPMEATRVLDPAPDRAITDRIMRDARALYPALREARVAQTWAGVIDVMPDELPVIGAARGLPGLTLATGMSGHGFGLGPGAGLLAAQLATGRAPCVDPAPFALERFG